MQSSSMESHSRLVSHGVTSKIRGTTISGTLQFLYFQALPQVRFLPFSASGDPTSVVSFHSRKLYLYDLVVPVLWRAAGFWR